MKTDSQNTFGLRPEALAAWNARKLVYVRSVTAAELSTMVNGLDDVPGDTMLYTVHASDGTPMAVLDNREAAFLAARQHEMEPVSVH